MENEEKIVKGISEDEDLVFLTPMDVAEVMGSSIQLQDNYFIVKISQRLRSAKILRCSN